MPHMFTKSLLMWNPAWIIVTAIEITSMDGVLYCDSCSFLPSASLHGCSIPKLTGQFSLPP